LSNGGSGSSLNKNPADVRVPESLRDVVGIVVVIHVLMVPPMIGNPRQRRVFKRRCAKNKRHEPHGPVRLKRNVGKKPW